MEAVSLLLEGRDLKCWKSTSAPILHENSRVTWAYFHSAFMKLYFPPALRQEKTIEILNLILAYR